jgi:hypothetical protein
MKKLLVVLAVIMFSFSLVIISQSQADSGFCFMCGSGSPCQYCKSASGKDTSADRKACESKGCKITGTASCPTAANVKVCN